MQGAVEQAQNHLNYLFFPLNCTEPVMSLDKTDVEKIAHLARLGINQQDIPEYAQTLSNIFALVEQMNEVDTSGIIPMAHPLDAVQRLREDKVTETDNRKLFQSIAPKTKAGVYLVPQVIE